MGTAGEKYMLNCSLATLVPVETQEQIMFSQTMKIKTFQIRNKKNEKNIMNDAPLTFYLKKKFQGHFSKKDITLWVVK